MSSRCPKTDFLPIALCITTALFIGDAADAATAVPCLDGTAKPLLDKTLDVGAAPQRVTLPAAKDSDLLVQIVEDGIEVEAALLDAQGHEVAAADYPVSRQGIQRLIVGRPSRGAVVTVRSVDQSKHPGTVRLLTTALPGSPTGCEQFARELARADGLFAKAQRAARGEGETVQPDAEAKAAAAEVAYRQIARSEAARRLDALRGDAELAVALIDYYNLGRWEESASWAGTAAASLEKAGQDYLRARARSLQAAAWLEKTDSVGAFARARAVFDALAAFHRSRGESYDEALQVNLAGVSWFNEAKFEPAIAKYGEARATFERLGETQRAALAVQNIALCEWGLGRMRKALSHFEQALASMDPAQRPTLYMLTLNNAALASQAAGDFDKSMHLLEDALQRATQLGDRYYRARSQFGIGVTYYGIGDRDLARQFLLDGLATWSSELDERGRLSALRTLANLEAEDGNLLQADRYNTEALKLVRSATARDRISLKLAETALARGDLASADRIIGSLADPRPQAERLTQAEARFVRARLRIKQGSLPAAEADLRAAIPVFRELESLSEEFRARVELAHLLKASGRAELAMREINAALDCSEELRAQTVNPEYRASVDAAIRPALDLRLELLRDAYDAFIRNGDPKAAQRVASDALALADTSRGRAFEQYRAQKLDRPDAQLQELLEQRADLLHDLADRRFFLETREDRGGPDDARAQALREDIRRLRVTLGVTDTKVAELTRTSKTAAARPIDAIVQRLKGGDTAAIEYWIGGEASYAWVIQGTRVTWIRIADGPDVTRAARRFHAALSDFATVPKRERLAAAEQLHALVIAPLRSALDGARHWVIVPDGALHFVPFVALKEPGSAGKYLVERVSLAMTPALRYAPVSSRAATPGRLLLVSDPIYQASDPRLVGIPPATRQFVRAELRLRGGGLPENLQRLPATAREADNIRALFPASAVDELRGADANRVEFLGRDLGQYRYLHVATHGVMDAEIPAMSALILGAYDASGPVRDQEIRAGDLLATSLDADLVVLSACETSLGRSFPDEGPMGLRYAVLARGARAVVSSLWMTADELNADLMTDLYAGMLGKGERVELALVDAMRKMLARQPNLDPALWAAYSVYVVDN